MAQTKKSSFIEAIANQIVGMSYAVLFYWYMFGFTVIEGLSTTAFFVVAGLCRIYVISRGFAWYDRRKG